MQRKRRGANFAMHGPLVFVFLLFAPLATGSSLPEFIRQGSYTPTPSTERLQALAEATGAAGFEHHTEDRPLVKRLIPATNQPDQDVVEHQGVIGKPGVDFPAYPNIPSTGFSCKNVPTGYYADLETDCQVFHICDTSRKISFLCPNGTIFSQSHLICDWWFKVDCASSPALYESSAEYYSNEQKKSHKITKVLAKNPELQQILEKNSASRNVGSNNLYSTTENIDGIPLNRQVDRAENYQPVYYSSLIPNQRVETSTVLGKRAKNLIQLVAKDYNNQYRSKDETQTVATYYKTTDKTNYNEREMQIAAESASFTNNNNDNKQQSLKSFNAKNYNPLQFYLSNTRTSKSPSLTTLYDIREDALKKSAPASTTKRPTLLPYTKSYTNLNNNKFEPYTRPGISTLKSYIEKEKNKTIATATERNDEYDDQSYDRVNKINNFNSESISKVPYTTKSQQPYTSPDLYTYFSTNDFVQVTPETSYQERRERLMRKLKFDAIEPTNPTPITDKFYGDQPNRPGLVVPPSLTPKTLHSLAIYYATAFDNATTTENDEGGTTKPTFQQYSDSGNQLPNIFSHKTIDKYSKLFGQMMADSGLLNEIKLNSNGTYNDLSNDLMIQQSQSALAASPQIRKLAQVFTHALSAYLQDPVQFRKALSDIRPTHPSFGNMFETTDDFNIINPTTTVNEEDDEILGFSDDNKIRPALLSLRDSKALNIATNPTPYEEKYEQQISISSTTNKPSTFASYNCCGKISAAYTTTSSPKDSVTNDPPTNTVAENINNLALINKNDETKNSYVVPKYAGFQNNSASLHYSPYASEINHTEYKPLSDYIQSTNLPESWGVDTSSTPKVINNIFESKKIKSPAIFSTTPVYFTLKGNNENDNEEELQRAHSQSFVNPSNKVRQGKNYNFNDIKGDFKKPSEELEAPTISDSRITSLPLTEQTITASKFESTTFEPSTDNDKNNHDFQLPSTYGSWQSSVIDPITLNDGLRSSGSEYGYQNLVGQGNTWEPNTETTQSEEYRETTEDNSSYSETSSSYDSNNIRSGRVLNDQSTTESGRDLTTIADTVVEKAKELMGGMNSSTTEKLMNVMKRTKSKTVKKLILLLVQTCDDDHNSTAEASKKALLEALMAVSQKDMEEIAKESARNFIKPDNENKNTFSKTDEEEKQENNQKSDRRGKSLNFDPNVINSLSTSANLELTRNIKDTEQVITTLRPVHRGDKKFFVKPTPTTEQRVTRLPFSEKSKPENKISPRGLESKATDTRALELLRSLYTIAARWG